MTTTAPQSPHPQTPLTDAAVRSLLWGGAARAESPAPFRAEDLDDLTLAKIRLLEMRRPPSNTLSAVLHNPAPWALAAFGLGAVVSRSKLARKALAWVGARFAKQSFKQGAKAFAARGAHNGRHNGKCRVSPGPRIPAFLNWMKSAS
jgi:hypothetical protein